MENVENRDAVVENSKVKPSEVQVNTSLHPMKMVEVIQVVLVFKVEKITILNIENRVHTTVLKMNLKIEDSKKIKQYFII